MADAPEELAEDDSELLDWIEAKSHELLLSHAAAADEIHKGAINTLTVLLAGIGGSLAYAVKVFEKKTSAVEWGAAAVCAYLACWAAVLVFKTLLMARAPAIANDPANLLNASRDRTFSELRREELALEQERIERYCHRNDDRAPWLNIVRVAAIASPLVFCLAAFLGSK